MRTRKTTVPAALILERLERRARQLLADVGALGEQYDSARVEQALGHVSEAAKALHEAGTVAKARAVEIDRPRQLRAPAAGAHVIPRCPDCKEALDVLGYCTNLQCPRLDPAR